MRDSDLKAGSCFKNNMSLRLQSDTYVNIMMNWFLLLSLSVMKEKNVDSNPEKSFNSFLLLTLC